MGFLSKLFGENKEDKALREALAHIHRILDDEEFQLELVHPVMKAMLESAPAYDKDPNGSGPFGFTETNPIPVNRPIGRWHTCPDSRLSPASASCFTASEPSAQWTCSRP
ncbi:MAG: hypothetical protein IPM40_21655 [Gammaproteobacteria bacterium]|nr:hypothetical protein [Gammaproteobacteria bacterium]